MQLLVLFFMIFMIFVGFKFIASCEPRPSPPPPYCPWRGFKEHWFEVKAISEDEIIRRRQERQERYNKPIADITE